MQLANLVGLVLVALGLPAAAGCQVGPVRLSHAPTATLLMTVGAALWAAGNAAAAVWLCRRKADRRLCWRWSRLFAVLAVMAWCQHLGWLNFEWLQRALLWLDDRM